FEEVGSTSQSGRQGTAVVLAADAGARASLSGLVPALPDDPDRVPLAAFQGQQRSGGYAIRIERIVREGDVLTVHARFVEPGPGDIVTMALTSPAQVVAVARADVEGVTTVVLIDQDGTERARSGGR
ncbi:MAG: protease complex subunit PrcB family protein, partial [Candidatus Limnocylindria bacterium]